MVPDDVAAVELASPDVADGVSRSAAGLYDCDVG